MNGSNGEVQKHPEVNNSAAEIATMGLPAYENIRLIRYGHQSTKTEMLEGLPPHAIEAEDHPSIVGWTKPCDVFPGYGGKKTCRVDFSSMCWFFGRNIFHKLADVSASARPIGLIQSCWSGSPDEDWMSEDAKRQCYAPPPAKLPAAGGMYNGMITPLLNTSIKGAIWYQASRREAERTDEQASQLSSLLLLLGRERCSTSRRAVRRLQLHFPGDDQGLAFKMARGHRRRNRSCLPVWLRVAELRGQWISL